MLALGISQTSMFASIAGDIKRVRDGDGAWAIEGLSNNASDRTLGQKGWGLGLRANQVALGRG